MNLYVQDVVKSVDGGLIMTGIFVDFNVGQDDIALIKTDVNGNEQWRQKLASTTAINHACSGLKAVQDSISQKIIIVGYQAINFESQSIILATDNLGNKLWQTSYNNPGGAGFFDVIQTKDKNFVSGCAINVNNDLGNFTRYKSLAVKFDINGNRLCSKTYDTLSPFTGISAFYEKPDGDIMMVGSLDTTINAIHTSLIRLRLDKIDKDGNLKWKKYIGFANSSATDENPKSIHPTQDGGFIIASHFVNGVNPRPYILIKVDSTGCDTLEAYCQSLITNISNFTNSSGWELNVFPNPAREVVNITLNALINEKIILKVRDVSGRLIEELIIEANQRSR